MPLSRLNNFLKSVRGNIIYVNPNDLDSTDSIENQGNSLTRPFKSIQRALIEAARFSYQAGLANDRFGKTTILVYPGDYTIDNRPGWIPYETSGTIRYKNRAGNTDLILSPYSLSSNFDLTYEDNDLYKLNSIHGGVIVPRGTSIVGLDLRKTKIRPKYVPNPENNNIESSTIFRVTGACYFWQFSIFDADPNDVVYKDYSNSKFVPNFSHHKLTCFEYADGTNKVKIGTTEYDQTDLEMYYDKIADVYDQDSGRGISPDYPIGSIDIQPKIDEHRIVGSQGEELVISNIISGDGITPTTTITVTTQSASSLITVDSPIQISGITASGYNGQYVVSEVLSTTQFQYKVQNAPTVAAETPTNATLNLVMDTVSSASPYIFNVSLRSVFGMCGMLADGSKATGFKSMVVAQFTGIGLQKDDKAFLLYDKTTGTYKDSTTQPNLHSNSKAVFKPSYRNFHIKCVNDSFIQVVSVFAIGFADHLVADSGGDMSVTNSNSNFGSRSLHAKGFKKEAFPRDDKGYITHIIPPKFIENDEVTVEFSSIDVAKTISVGNSSRLYLYNETNDKVLPSYVIDGFRVGNKVNDTLNVLISSSNVTEEKSARIIMSDTAGSGNEVTFEKSFYISRGTNDTNQISSNTITLTQSHNFNDGETIRFLADKGDLFEGVDENVVYYAITSGVAANQLKVATSFSDALSGNAVQIYPTGGSTKVVSRVYDKKSGDVGHPVQYDSTNSNWYINVATSSQENSIYSTLVTLGTSALGSATSRTYIKRVPEVRNLVDTIHRYRLSIPKTVSDVRPPIDGFIIQESNSTGGRSTTEIQATTLSSQTDKRNYKFISNISYSSGTVTVTTEKPHRLTTGSTVEIVNVKSTSNTTGASNKGYNTTSEVLNVTSDKTFTYSLSSDPGTFINNINARTTSEVPYVKRKKYSDNFYIYRTREVRKQTYNVQDGVYHVITLNSKNNPTASQFSSEGFSQKVADLYPQRDRDNPISNKDSSKSYASSKIIGKVTTNDLQKSITKETLDRFLINNNIGIGITNIVSSVTGVAHTIHTNIQHGLNPIISVGIQSAGWKYGSGSSGTLYSASLTGSVTGESAKANIAIDANGAITSIDIVDGGSGYVVGDTLNIVGVATTSGHIVGIVSVTRIYDSTNEVISLSGVSSSVYQNYNNMYRITSVPNSKQVLVSSAQTISGFNTTGLNGSFVTNAFYYNVGKAIGITSFTYDRVSGIATVVSSNPHGLDINNIIQIVGAGQSFYNGDFSVSKIIPAVSGASTSFNLKIGVSTSTPSISGTLYGFRKGLYTNNGDTAPESENVGQRMSTIYAGITTSLSLAIADEITTSVSITDVANSGLKLGDYIAIDDEIFRIASTINASTTNPITVFRGLFGTIASAHLNGSEVRKISIIPIELRRNSIIRASNHTFEYLGFGPGNYSTAFPDKQDRILTSEESLLAQSTKQDGGIVVFTGMNDKGDFYIGNKRVSSATGQEEIFDAPVPTVSGEDNFSSGVNVGFDVLTPLEVSISRAIRVEGGPKHDIVSEFNGPTVFGQKVTVNSQFEANSLLVQGDAKVSRKYTVGVSTPILAGNPGDITYYSDPSKGEHLGWVYTRNNDWYRFGNISLSKDANINLFDKIGIGVTRIDNNINFQVGIGTSAFLVTGIGSVGIGSTLPTQRLDVLGGINASNSISIGNSTLASITGGGVVYLFGDGSNLKNLPNDSLWGTTNPGFGTGIYPYDLLNVGIGTSVPRFNLEVGTPGTATTSFWVNNQSRFIGTVNVNNDLTVSNGAFISTITNINNDIGIGTVTVGVVTATTRLNVGVGGSIIQANADKSVGIRTTSVRPGANIDLEGRTRLSSYFETVNNITATSTSRISLDVSRFQNFVVTTDNVNIDGFDMINCPPEGSFSFTLAITQGATARTVDIQDFTRSTTSATGAPITGGTSPGQPKWNGGVEPTVTSAANASDIYTFVTFDGGASLFGITGGQNFS